MTEALNIADNYLFNELFYDSPLEKENICEKVSEVSVFTKMEGVSSRNCGRLIVFDAAKRSCRLSAKV